MQAESRAKLALALQKRSLFYAKVRRMEENLGRQITDIMTSITELKSLSSIFPF